ncbi:hypothetical protein HYFRA_00001674 [Hymenoscyphus fraxineus]|uniref:DUF7770 domain-containing protein n=1 Tax=Hymenoscyphus fraxineus TaxID=746836 RepID=A0A9N9PZI9_9HELO|nr:hypothetical protein HYFRA_00001674 [Hymenoscyphus fraxineus]
MPYAYIPKSLANTIPSKPVTASHLPQRLPAHAITLSEDAKLTNHWVMYLNESPTKAIRLDPSPTGPGNSLDLIISDNCVYTDDAVKTVQLSVAANLTVGQIIDHVVGSGFDKYIFSLEGQGCRFWLHTVVASLLEVGCVVDEEEVEVCNEALEAAWEDQETRIPVSQSWDYRRLFSSVKMEERDGSAGKGGLSRASVSTS